MADELTPSQFLELDKNHLKGLLLKSGGTTSHTVILAVRSTFRHWLV
ncbi:PEP-utilizing enzyme [Escherichia coli]